MTTIEERLDTLERKYSELESCHIDATDRNHELISAQLRLQTDMIEVLSQLKGRLDTLEGK